MFVIITQIIQLLSVKWSYVSNILNIGGLIKHIVLICLIWFQYTMKLNSITDNQSENYTFTYTLLEPYYLLNPKALLNNIFTGKEDTASNENNFLPIRT